MDISVTYPTLNSTITTPDGEGIVKRIEVLASGKVGVVCALKNPYKVVDAWSGQRKYGYPPYSFGYTYLLTDCGDVGINDHPVKC